MFSFLKKKKSWPGIDPGTPIAEARYVVIDTELTGLDENKDSIVSVGAIRMQGGKIALGETFYRLVSPGTELKADSVVIHGITPSEVAAEPAIGTVLEEFISFCGNAVLVGHFVSIDLAFINRELKRSSGRRQLNPAIDTFSMYEWLRKRLKTQDCFATPLEGYRLYDIIKCFSIPISGAHNAVMDAYATAQLFQRFLPFLADAGVCDIDDLLKLGAPFKGGDNFILTNEFGNF